MVLQITFKNFLIFFKIEFDNSCFWCYIIEHAKKWGDSEMWGDARNFTLDTGS